jgi:hypothetical protein
LAGERTCHPAIHFSNTLDENTVAQCLQRLKIKIKTYPLSTPPAHQSLREVGRARKHSKSSQSHLEQKNYHLVGGTSAKQERQNQQSKRLIPAHAGAAMLVPDILVNAEDLLSCRLSSNGICATKLPHWTEDVLPSEHAEMIESPETMSIHVHKMRVSKYSAGPSKL